MDPVPTDLREPREGRGLETCEDEEAREVGREARRETPEGTEVVVDAVDVLVLSKEFLATDGGRLAGVLLLAAEDEVETRKGRAEGVRGATRGEGPLLPRFALAAGVRP